MYLIITTAKILIGFTFCGNYIITVICIDNVKASFHNNLHWFSAPIAIQHLAVNAQVYNVVRWWVFNRMDRQVSMYVCLAWRFITSSSFSITGRWDGRKSTNRPFIVQLAFKYNHAIVKLCLVKMVY